MPNDLFKGQNFANGEGLVWSDFNDLARFPDSRLLDQMLLRQVGALGSAADPHLVGSVAGDPGLTSLVYTMTGGDAIIKEGTTGTRIGLSHGTIFQKINSAVTGNEPVFLPYTVRATDVDLVVAAGHATLPRIDILQVALTWESGSLERRDIEDAVTRVVTSSDVSKRRRVLATFSIKAGTPAATPSYPAPDTGYAMIGAMRVPALWTTGVAGYLRQCTVPLSVQAYPQHALEIPLNGTNWARNVATGLGHLVASGGAATGLHIWAPGGTGQRIVGLDIYGEFETSAAITLNQVLVVAGSQSISYGSAQPITLTPTVDGAERLNFFHLGQIADGSGDSNPSAANGPVGDPFWAAGGKEGPSKLLITSGQVLARTCLVIDAGLNSKIHQVTWYLAG